jgi:hypothetical protein
MVKYLFVDDTRSTNPASPIGAFAALWTGFNCLVAKPYLILAPLALDAFLWFTPRLTLVSIFREMIGMMILPPNTDPIIADQMKSVLEAWATFGDRFNLLSILGGFPINQVLKAPGMTPMFNPISILSIFPVAIRSVMAARMPVENPFGILASIELSDPLQVAGLWMMLTIIGLGLGTLFHRAIAAGVAPGAKLGTTWRSIIHIILFMFLLFGVVLFAGTGMMLVIGLVSLLFSATISMLLLFFGFSLIFWVAVYLAFTPHGIIRYRLNLFRAMAGSVTIVRRNFLGAIGFIVLALGIGYIGSWVWLLPPEESWFNILGILGHSFVSATILAASYIFYQGRYEWGLALLARQNA